MKKVIEHLGKQPVVRATFWVEDPFDTSEAISRRQILETLLAIGAVPGGVFLVGKRLAEYTGRQYPVGAHTIMQHSTSVQAAVSTLLS